MKKQVPFGQDVLILGGGQLARMLAQAGQRMGHNMSVLSESIHDSAVQVTGSYFLGNPKDPDSIRRTLEQLKSPVTTIESEFIPGGMLDKVFRQNTGWNIFPSPMTILMLQHRLRQKEALLDRDIPTAPFVSVKSKSDLAKALKKFGHGFVLKACMNGYDGRGTTIVRLPADYDRALALDFQSESAQGYIAEQFVDFNGECALTATRSIDGNIAFFPLVKTCQTHNQLDWLYGPIEHPKLPELQSRVRDFLNEISFVGSITFELFDIRGELLVNEIAPRVHNSAHHTIDSCNVSQFEQHLRAILGYELIKPEAVSPFAMVNLIGSGAKQATAPIWSQGRAYWYGKGESREGRKMGHITLLGSDPGQCLQVLLDERNHYVL